MHTAQIQSIQWCWFHHSIAGLANLFLIYSSTYSHYAAKSNAAYPITEEDRA